MAAKFARGDARMYAQKFIVRGIREGLSGNQILQNLRSASVDGQSLGYRTETFYADYNRYLEAKTPPSLVGLANIPKNLNVAFSLKFPTTGGNRWQYPVIVSGTNRDTGESVTRMVSLVSPFPIDESLLPGALENINFTDESNIEVNWDQSQIQQPRQYYSELP